MWLEEVVQVQMASRSTTSRFKEIRTKRSDGSMSLNRSAVLKSSSRSCSPVLERFTSTCCQSVNRRLAAAIGYHEIWPHDGAYAALSTEYLAGW
jgi:hypothetical protein